MAVANSEGQVVLQSELDAFKASIPQHECVLAEWFLRKVLHGYFSHSHVVGNMYLVISTELSVYMLKLKEKKVHSSTRFNLMDICNIQTGYLSKGDEPLDECEVKPGLYAIRFCYTNKSHHTFKHPADEVSDEIQKAYLQAIHSSLKASRRELFHNVSPSPTSSSPSRTPSLSVSIPIPSTKERASPSPSPPNISPSSSFKESSFIATTPGHCYVPTEEYEPLVGTFSVTQKQIVFEPTQPGATNVPVNIFLGAVMECDVLPVDDDDLSSAQLTLLKSQNERMLQVFADGLKWRFAIPAVHANDACTRIIQRAHALQEKAAQELLSQSEILKPPLLTKDDTTTNFRGDSDILTAKDVLYLQFKMPDRHSLDQWELVYSTMRHGISMNTFYTKVKERAPTLLIVEDSHHHVFGFYAPEPWEKSNTSHYGSGESFLFKIKPTYKIFKWTKKNDYFMFSSKDFISAGGGTGSGYGIWLDADFDQGHSSSCETFDNEPLTDAETFRVLKVEVWSVPGVFKRKGARPL